MIDLTDSSNNNHFADKSDKEQNIDIVNYQTVSFDPKYQKTKRSLSLNVYKYEQMLTPKDGQFSSVESLISDMDYKQNSSYRRNTDMTTNKLFNSFGLVVSLFSLILLAAVVFVVMENKSEGNASIIFKIVSYQIFNLNSF